MLKVIERLKNLFSGQVVYTVKKKEESKVRQEKSNIEEKSKRQKQ